MDRITATDHRILSDTELSRHMLNSDGPAYEAKVTSRNADLHGITPMAYRTRFEPSIRQPMGKPAGSSQLPSMDEVCRLRIFLNLDEEKAKRRQGLVEQRCGPLVNAAEKTVAWGWPIAANSEDQLRFNIQAQR